jgi:hypothetical protein
MLQRFVDKPVLPPEWDWQGETADKVRAKFTPDYIYLKYLSQALKGTFPGKGR